MLVKSVSALAVLAFAAHVSATPEKPSVYKPLMKMSVHQMFGVHRRQEDGYHPTQSTCGEGATCADACGAGYDTCASSGDTIHCYNPAAKQTCCPDNTGNSCDDGYYCTADKAGATWCCADNLDLAACAAQFGVTGGLVSETAKPTTSSSSSSTSSSSIVITTSSSSSSSTFLAQNTTTTATSTGTVTTCTSTLGGTATWPASNTTTTAKVPSVVASSTPLTVSISGASTVGAAGALSLLAAAAIAALL